MVGHGQVSVSGAADLARCATDDGLLHDAVSAFSSLGASGSCPSNCERDMTRWLKHLFDFTLEPYSITLQLQVFCKRLGIVFASWCLLFTPNPIL